jgi:hypothetical protein
MTPIGVFVITALMVYQLTIPFIDRINQGFSDRLGQNFCRFILMISFIRKPPAGDRKAASWSEPAAAAGPKISGRADIHCPASDRRQRDCHAT